MIDGIIQEVFNNFWAHNECEECKYAHEEVLPRLIEKIKQDFEECDKQGCIDHYLHLIGDNQE